MEITKNGRYFKNIYQALFNQMHNFPNNDEPPNIQQCISKVNFIRAETLARKHNLPTTVVKELQECAIFQYFTDYENIQGLCKLSDDFNLALPERQRLIDLIMKEKEYPWFPHNKRTKMSIDENWSNIWQTRYSPIAKAMIGEKQSLIRRLLNILHLG